MKKTHSLNEGNNFSNREDWEEAANASGYEITSWGYGSAHALDRSGKIVGTWVAEFDTSDSRPHGNLTTKTRAVNEGLEYKDMVDMIKPTVYVDEFKSKVGEDDAYVVLSFYVHNIIVAEDLIKWFETGYPFVIDADRSPGEIEPNRYLVFVEMKRRTQLIEQIEEILEDFATLTDLEIGDWTVTYNDIDHPFDKEVLANALILSPQSYREENELELNEMRMASGIPHKNVYRNTDEDLNKMRMAANIPTKNKVVTDPALIQMQRNARIK